MLEGLALVPALGPRVDQGVSVVNSVGGRGLGMDPVADPSVRLSLTVNCIVLVDGVVRILVLLTRRLLPKSCELGTLRSRLTPVIHGVLHVPGEVFFWLTVGIL